MSKIAALAVLGLMIANPAAAATASHTSFGLLLPARHQLVISVTNTCTTTAKYVATFKGARSGDLLQQLQGSLAAKRGAMLVFTGAVQRNDIVVPAIAVTCDGSVTPQPLVGMFLRNSETLVPVMPLTVQRGPGI